MSPDYGTDANLPEWAVDEYREWLKERYDGDIEKLNVAWNMDVHSRGGKTREERYFTDWSRSNTSS